MKPGKLRKLALEMLDELRTNCLVVIKVPIENGYKRIVCSQNAKWYREFCGDHISHQHGRFSRPRTFIKRIDTEKALLRIANGKTDTIYAQRLIPYIHQFASDKAEQSQRYVHEYSAVGEF
jgi:hypothetical protein